MIAIKKNDADNAKKRWPILSIVFLALLLWGFFLAGSVSAEVPMAGGKLAFGTENDFAGFELLQSGSRLAINGSIAANTIMEPLFRMDEREELIPVLGQSAKPSDDGRAWTIRLRPGVLFHDGTPFTAAAVVHHWMRMLKPENNYRGRSALRVITDVTMIDTHTVRFELKHPWLPFKRAISSTRTLINLIPSPKAVESGIQNRAPVGTGPFKIKSWKSGEAFTVVRNPNYWQKGLPHLDEIVFRPMADSQTRFASLKSGQMDIIWMDRGNLLDKADSDDSLVVHEGDDNGAEIFILNTGTPPLDNVLVRRALAHAIDQDRQVAMVYKNSIPFVRHPFGRQCNCPGDGYLEHDQEKARQLLADYGQPVAIEVLHSSSKRGRDIGEITQQLLKAVGVKSSPKGLDFGPIIKKVLSGRYQVSTWRISSRPDQGPALFLMLHSKSRANYSRYKNPEMDRLLVAQRMETDPVRRREILCRIAGLINTDVPLIYRGGMRSHVITRARVRGLPKVDNGIVRFETAWLVR